MENKFPKQLTLHTGLLALINMLLVMLAFFCKHELERIEENQKQIWVTFVPRQELEVQTRQLQVDILDLRTRVAQIELQAVNTRKGP